MRLLVFFALGVVAGAVIWRFLAPSLRQPPFLVENYRKAQLPTAAGLVLPLVLLLLAALTSLGAVAGLDDLARPSNILVPTLCLVAGFALFGLLDDLAAAVGDRGFQDHMRALASGRLTTGALKLVGGGALSIVVVAHVRDGNIAMLVIDGAVVALSANLTNLLDLAPGRTTKVSMVWAAVLAVVSGFDPVLWPIAIVMGAAAALLVPDLRERMMLGDTGANVLGAVLGFGTVVTAPWGVRLGVLIGLVGLTVVGDVVGFSKIIRSTPLLRYLDHVGRLKTM